MTESHAVKTDAVDRRGPAIELGTELDARSAGQLARDLPGLGIAFGEMLKKWEADYGGRTIARLPSGEPMIELPFTLKKDGRIIRGRIDAVYQTEDGGLEIVDFKTGKYFEKSDEADQLELYAEALRANGLLAGYGGEITLAYAFIGEDSPDAP